VVERARKREGRHGVAHRVSVGVKQRSAARRFVSIFYFTFFVLQTPTGQVEVGAFIYLSTHLTGPRSRVEAPRKSRTSCVSGVVFVLVPLTVFRSTC